MPNLIQKQAIWGLHVQWVAPDQALPTSLPTPESREASPYAVQKEPPPTAGKSPESAHCFSIKWGWPGEKPDWYNRRGSKGGKAERCSCNQTLLPRWSSTEAPSQEQHQRRGEAGGLPLPQEPSQSPDSPRTTLPTGLSLQVCTHVQPRLLDTTWALPSSKGRWVDVGIEGSTRAS